VGTGPRLTEGIDIAVIHDADHRVATGDRMIGSQDHGLAIGRHLDSSAHDTF
jgi:hypothetical protein